MTDDGDLLSRFAREGDESAFSELVRRHIDFVFATAQRSLGGNSHTAEDVAQRVFAALARNCREVSPPRVLKAWLYTVTRNKAAQAVRSERRRTLRHAREETLTELYDRMDPTLQRDWERLRPAIDEALERLDERDREAVLLRYFEGMAYPAIADRLELSAGAALLRVQRALERMRPVFARHGISSVGAAISSVLLAEANVCAPPGFAVSVSAGAIAAAASGGVFTTAGAAAAGAFMSMNKIAIAGLAVLAVGGGALVAIQRRANERLADDVARLSQDQSVCVALERENNSLVEALKTRKTLEESNRTRATRISEMPDFKRDIASLRARIRQMKSPAAAKPPALSAAAAALMMRVPERLAAKDWDGALALASEMMRNSPAGSYDSFVAEDTLFKILWQGENDLGQARLHLENAISLVSEHPEYLNADEIVDHQEWLTELNWMVAQDAAKLGKAGSPVAVPDQWFPEKPL